MRAHEPQQNRLPLRFLRSVRINVIPTNRADLLDTRTVQVMNGTDKPIFSRRTYIKNRRDRRLDCPFTNGTVNPQFCKPIKHPKIVGDGALDVPKQSVRTNVIPTSHTYSLMSLLQWEKAIVMFPRLIEVRFGLVCFSRDVVGAVPYKFRRSLDL